MRGTVWQVRAFHLFILALALPLAHAHGVDDAQTGLSASKDAVGKLIPLFIRDGRLVLDKEAWENYSEKEPKDPEEAKIFWKDKIAKDRGIPVEQVSDDRLNDNMKMMRMEAGGLSVLFNEVMAKGGGKDGGTGSGYSGTFIHMDANRTGLKGHLEFDAANFSFGLNLKENGASKRFLIVTDGPVEGLTLRLENPRAETSLLLVQSAGGPVGLIAHRGKEVTTLSAESFEALLKAAPDKVQLGLLRPLAEIGILPSPSSFLPTVMAAATSGYGASAQEHKQKADALIAKLADEDTESREKATAELIRLFPHAVLYIEQTAANAQDAETRTRLNKAIAAHPGIAMAKAFVESKKLHEDRAYLLELLAHVPFFKVAAKARLTELYGQDYGDDPVAWPKKEK